MGTFCDIQSDSSICMNQRRQPLKITECRVILRKLKLPQQNLPRGTSVPSKPRESSDDSKSPPASLGHCLREEMASSNTCINSFSESAEDDWYFQLTGAYDGSSEKDKDDNGTPKLRNKNKEPKQDTQDDSPANRRAHADNPAIDTASEKASVKPDECTREERIRKLKVLLEQQEKAVTNIQVRSERTADIFQSLSGEEMMTSAFTDGRCVQKNAARNVQANGFLSTKNCANESSRVEALASMKKKCDAGVQVDLYAQLPQERRMMTEQGGPKDEETQIEKGGLESSSKAKNGESTLASIKVEHRRNGVIFSVDQLQGRQRRKVGVKVKNMKERGKAKSLKKVKTISTSGTIQDRSKGFVGSGGKQQGKKRQALDVNAKGRSSQPSGGSCKRKKGSKSKNSIAVDDSWRDEIEQLMKKEQRSCEEFMIILGLKCVNKGS